MRTETRRRRMALVCAAAVLSAAMATSACRTIEGRYLADVPGEQCADGIPMRVEKPRYLALTYKTVIYGQQAGPRKVMLRGEEYLASGGYVITSTKEEIETKIVTTGEIFAVDTKRPASGEITYAYQFDAGRQYPNTLSTKLEDTTVQDVVALAKALKEGAPDATSISESITRNDKARKSEQLMRGAGALVKLAEAVARIEYYDLWITDAEGFPAFAFQVEMDAKTRAKLGSETESSGAAGSGSVAPPPPPPPAPAGRSHG